MATKKINKVMYGDKTLIDLTSDTVSRDNMLEDARCYDNKGNWISSGYLFNGSRTRVEIWDPNTHETIVYVHRF